MPVPFQFPYLITQDTPAVALEVQANLDALLQWIQTNYVQLDDSPGFDVNLAMPSPSAGDNQVVTKSYIDQNVVPTGTILMWAPTTLPNTVEWEWCRGQSVSTTDPKYQGLFAAIGYTFGGSGGNFTLPDMRGKFPLGVNPGTYDAGDAGGSADAVVVAHGHDDTFAVNNVGSAHTHADNFSTAAVGGHTHSGTGLTVSSDTHSHSAGSLRTVNPTNRLPVLHFTDDTGNPSLSSGGAPSPLYTSSISWSLTGSTGSDTHNHAISGSTGGGGDHFHNVTGEVQSTNSPHVHGLDGSVLSAGESGTGKNMPPYAAVNFMIKL